MSAETISYLPTVHRLLPQSPDAERGLLCSLLISSMAVGAMCAEKNIRPEHFHLPAHAMIFSRIWEMWVENKPIDLLTITQKLRDHNELDHVGGAGYVTEISTTLPTHYNAASYADTLHEKLILRRLIAVCTEHAARAYDEQDDPEGLLEEATTKVCGISTASANIVRPKTPMEIALEANDRAQERVEKRGLEDYIMRTGIIGLDDAMSGIRPADYVLISGKEKSGKSSLAFNIFEHVVFQQEKRAMVVSLEMKVPEITDRLIASMGRVSLTNILNGWMTEEESIKFTNVTNRISKAKFQWRDDLDSLGQIVAAFRQYKATNPDLELGIVDYLQMIDAEKQKKEELREQAIAAISRTLRRLSSELNIGMIMLVQLNEDGQVRESRSPGMDCTAHIRIEPGEEEGLKWARIVYQRNGPSNVGVPLKHFGQFVRFEQGTARPEPEPKSKRKWHAD